MASDFNWETDRFLKKRARQARRKIRSNAWRRLHWQRVTAKRHNSTFTQKLSKPARAAKAATLSLLPAPPSKSTSKALARRLRPIQHPKQTLQHINKFAKALIKKNNNTLTWIGHCLDTLSFVGVLAAIGALFAISERPIETDTSIALTYGAVSLLWILLRYRESWWGALQSNNSIAFEAPLPPKLSSLQAKLRQLDKSHF